LPACEDGEVVLVAVVAAAVVEEGEEGDGGADGGDGDGDDDVDSYCVDHSFLLGGGVVVLVMLLLLLLVVSGGVDVGDGQETSGGVLLLFLYCKLESFREVTADGWVMPGIEMGARLYINARKARRRIGKFLV
jgi:hypothetical protein